MNEESVRLWRYVLPSERGEGWAEIVLGSDGFFGAVSDWGNYAFAWRSFGDKDFREFMIRVANDPGYVRIKLDPSEIYDGKATCEGIKKYILEWRRSRDMSREEARSEWGMLDEYDVEGDEHGFRSWYDDTQIECANEFYCTRPSAQAVAFCEKVLPRLAAVLRAELAAEKEAA